MLLGKEKSDMLRIAVCDDSRADVEQFEAAFCSLRGLPVEYDVYFSAEELLRLCTGQGEKYHLYVFDIEMPGMSGLELAGRVRETDAKALFVFLTGYTDYAMEVFEVITFDYISKPITPGKLEAVLLKAMRYLDMTGRDFAFTYARRHYRIGCDEIIYIEKKGRQAVIHTDSGAYRTNMTTGELWEQLDRRVFTHIHVSYIINLSRLRSVEGDEAVMDSGDRLLVARSQKQEVKNRHMEFVRGAV